MAGSTSSSVCLSEVLICLLALLNVILPQLFQSVVL